MIDMHLIYRLAECNSAKARRLYADCFHNRHLSDKKTFQRLHQWLRDIGTFKKRVSDSSKPVNIKTGNLKEQNLNYPDGNILLKVLWNRWNKSMENVK